jgi:hypothetical protein
MALINEDRSWVDIWFRPELALPAEDTLKVTGLFAVDWLPYMLIAELLLSTMMRKQVWAR